MYKKFFLNLSQAYKEAFLDIFFPKRCIVCGKYGLFLCSECSKTIKIFKTPTCYYCGKITKFCVSCSSCKNKNKSNLNGIYYAASFKEGCVKEIVHYFKYNGISELSGLLSSIMAKRLENNLPKGNPVVVPVPLSLKRERKRGFNQSELIARKISEKLHLNGGTALAKIRDTSSQVQSQGKEIRSKNLRDSFICTDKELIENKTILLVDDIITTGSTLEECAITLKKAGAKKVYGAVIASARY